MMNERDEFHNPHNWHTRGYLPHYDAANKYQMITYRLADSLPQEALAAKDSLPHEVAGSAGGPPANDKLQRRTQIESYLDKGYGSCLLKAAQIVIGNWRYFDGKRYDLIAYVVMPNHVHVLIKTYEGYPLSKIVHSWKSYTGHEIKKLLVTDGVEVAAVSIVSKNAAEPPALPAKVKAFLEPDKAIWQEDYWDRFIRDEKHFTSALSYILENHLP